MEIHDNTKELLVLGTGIVLAAVVSFRVVNYLSTFKANREYIIDAEYEDTVIEKDQ